jgi:hypothetical protein
MKHFTFILVTIFFALSVSAQVKQEVIASAGGYNEAGIGSNKISISWTLGETIIPTYSSGNLILTHGFQQQLIVTAVEENIDVAVNVKVFPNPASEFVNIRFEAPVNVEIVVTVIDSQGKLVKKDIIESSMSEKQINLQDVPAGIYYLRLAKGNLVNIYKVVKL